jgi:hypothetical protein
MEFGWAIQYLLEIFFWASHECDEYPTLQLGVTVTNKIWREKIFHVT